MSCGNPHDANCTEVLAALDAYLDNEDTPLDRAVIAQHLAECGPCLREQDIDRVVRALVARACASESCSDSLRARIVTRIRETSVTAVPGVGVVTTQSSITTVSTTD